MTALDNLKFDCSEIFIQSISFYCSAGDNWGKPRKWRSNLRIERDDPSCKLDDRILVEWLCERNIFIVLITLRFTQTLSCHLIWLVGRCMESGLSWVRSVCGQSGGCESLAFLTSGDWDPTPGTQWAQWHAVTRTRILVTHNHSDLVGLTHTSLTEPYQWEKVLRRVPGSSAPSSLSWLK